MQTDGEGEGALVVVVGVRGRFQHTSDAVIAVGLLVVAVAGWWWSLHTSSMNTSMGMADAMSSPSMSTTGFFVAWVAMMAAMMAPAILPAVRLFDRAAGRGLAAPTPLFITGYFAVWSAMGGPAYFAWRALARPLADGDVWAARLAASTLVVAGIYQISPLKGSCLRHCRSPLSFFMHLRTNVRRPLGAVRAGAAHGLVCLGCCWALMAVLVALGTMQLGWMILLAALIFTEKVLPIGPRIASVAAVAFVVFGLAVWVHPHLLSHVT